MLALSNRTIAGIIQRTLHRFDMRCTLADGPAPAVTDEFDAVMVDVRLRPESAFVNSLLKTQPPTIMIIPIGEKIVPNWWSSLRRSRTVTAPVKTAVLRHSLEQLFSPALESAPAADSSPVTNVNPKEAVPLGSRLPLKLLVTDDNVINQKVAARLLQQLGYTADIASNGAEAMAAAEKTNYDMIFMDVQMPGMDGMETTRRIREMERGRKRRPAKIVAMTANAMAGDRDKCLSAGMDDYLAKPVRPENLHATIEKLARVQPQLPSAAASTAPTGSASVSTTTRPQSHVENHSPETSDEIPVDLDRLLEFSGGSRTSLIEITDLYFEQTTEQLERLERALDQNNTTALIRAAHSSAGASGVCGIVAMESLFRRVEQSAKDNRLGDVRSLLSQLHRKFERVKVSLLNSRENLPLS